MTDPPSDPEARSLDDTRTQIRRLEKSVEAVGKRVESVESWPRSVIVAICTGALGMIITVAGATWTLSAQLARLEASNAALGDRISRVEDRLDRMEERTWRSTPTAREE